MSKQILTFLICFLCGHMFAQEIVVTKSTEQEVRTKHNMVIIEAVDAIPVDQTTAPSRHHEKAIQGEALNTKNVKNHVGMGIPLESYTSNVEKKIVRQSEEKSNEKHHVIVQPVDAIPVIDKSKD